MTRTLSFKPVITEKSMHLASQGQFTLIVPRGTEKLEIARALEVVYKVHVLSVNILRRAPKVKRRGTITGSTSEKTKAIVRLKQGEKIPGFETVGQEPEPTQKPVETKQLKQEKK
ncbi:MAG: 50S ribosomal protein L23 [Patescibacteria group bacterium]